MLSFNRVKVPQSDRIPDVNVDQFNTECIHFNICKLELNHNCSIFFLI